MGAQGIYDSEEPSVPCVYTRTHMRTGAGFTMNISYAYGMKPLKEVMKPMPS